MDTKERKKEIIDEFKKKKKYKHNMKRKSHNKEKQIVFCLGLKFTNHAMSLASSLTIR